MKKKSLPLTFIEPEEIAEAAGLEYVNDHKAGFTRKIKNKKFQYFDLNNRLIKNPKEIKRINALAIPPAYTDVWICPKPSGHIQATARDAKGRKQYRYHARWREVSDETKYNKMIAFGQALPSIRKRISKDLSLAGMQKEKILAAVVHLLEITLIRVGNEEYAKQNKSFGLTTLLNRHVDVNGNTLTFKFKGKSGKNHNISLSDKRLAKIVKNCKALPGQELFEYVNENSEIVSINSSDVNNYLKSITNDYFTAKDFRTWAGTVLAVYALQEFQQFDSDVQAKKNIVQAIEKVAKKLGNTPSICRKCYVHPEVLNAYLDGSLIKIVKKRTEEELLHSLTELSSEEAAVLAFLQQRLDFELEKTKHIAKS